MVWAKERDNKRWLIDSLVDLQQTHIAVGIIFNLCKNSFVMSRSLISFQANNLNLEWIGRVQSLVQGI